MSDNRIIKGRKKLNDGNMKLDIDILCKAFTKLPNLTSLDVNNNGFGKHTSLIIHTMSRSLKALNLSNNEIGEHGDATTNALTNLINLTYLNLSNNNLDNSTLKVIKTYPKAFHKLKFLEITKNFDTETIEFAETIKVFDEHNKAVQEPLFNSFCKFLIVHPEIDPYVASDIIGDHHDHTITLYHD